MNKDQLKELRFLLKNSQYREVPFLTFDSFLQDCLGIGEDVYQTIRVEGNEIVRLIWEKQITEADLYWGIGSGKSLLSAAMTLYIAHLLLCYKNPHEFFHLMNDKAIAIINMGTSATQAKNVVFTSMTTFIDGSEWFKRFEYEALGTEVRFYPKGKKDEFGNRRNPNIIILCGNSKETTPLGLNIYAAILDELAFYLNNDKKNVAKEIYDTMQNRMTSRFGMGKGFIMPISSARYEDDAMDTLYKANVKEHGKTLYCSKKCTWDVKDRSKMAKETFDFVSEYDDNGDPKVVLKDIPIDFKSAFVKNAEKALRDFACIPSKALSPFDRDAQIVERQVNKEREDPLTVDGRLKKWVKGDGKRCVAHIDLGLTKDACGVCVASSAGHKFVNDERIEKVRIELMAQIKAPEGGEVQFSDVRQLLYSMIERGFKIKKVTFDGWQSADSIQILERKGIEADVRSIDRTTEAYDTLKEVLHADALDYYHYVVKNEKGESVAIFEKEYQTLELIKGKKVDHPDTGSKDVADAVAGAVIGIIEDSGESFGIT
jgi:hypothetical protein